MIDGFELVGNYQKMPERPDSWFNPDESDDPFDAELDELEEIDDEPSDNELKGQEQKACDELQNDFFKYQKERGNDE